MTDSPERLIQDLIHNANASGHRALEQRLADLTVWFYQNKNRIPRENLPRRQDFLEKSFWIMCEISALLIERNRELELGQRKGGASTLFLPRGMKANGSMQEFG